MTAREFYPIWRKAIFDKLGIPQFHDDDSYCLGGDIMCDFADEFAELVSSKAAEAPGGQDARLERAAKRIAENWTLNTQTYSSVWREEKIIDILKEELAAPAAPSERGDERKKFEEWVKKDGFPDADLSQCGCAAQMRRHYQDAFTDFAYRAWQARAGLSSQEGK